MFPIRDHNPSGRTPYVTYALILLNVGIFFGYWLTIPSENELGWFFVDWGLVPAEVSRGEKLSGFLTSMFLHGGLMHLGGNMLFLWIYGDNLEDIMGHAKYLAFYLAAGVVAALAQTLAEPNSLVPMVGASGAIAGVMGGYLLLFPKARVDVLIIFVIFFRVFPIPAWILLGLWFGMQVLSGMATPTEMGGVAYWAHIGGFAAGLVLTIPVFLRLGGFSYWSRTHGEPQHPAAEYTLTKTSIPSIRRRK